LKKITSEKGQEVAKKYMLPDQMTVVVLDPQPIDPNKKPAGKPHAH